MIALREKHASLASTHPGSPGKTSSAVSLLHEVRLERKQRRLRREAENAVAAVAVGKSREEVREMLLGELARRHLTPPPQPRLDNLADILRTADPAERDRLKREGREMLRDAISPLAQQAKRLIKPE
jgi:hypothetical protein